MICTSGNRGVAVEEGPVCCLVSKIYLINIKWYFTDFKGWYLRYLWQAKKVPVLKKRNYQVKLFSQGWDEDGISPGIGRQMEYLIRGGRNACCVLAGGLSCFRWCFSLLDLVSICCHEKLDSPQRTKRTSVLCYLDVNYILGYHARNDFQKQSAKPLMH